MRMPADMESSPTMRIGREHRSRWRVEINELRHMTAPSDSGSLLAGLGWCNSDHVMTEETGSLVQYKWYGGEKRTRRVSGQRVWKIIKDLGKRVGVDTIHPHAFRHACGVELHASGAAGSAEVVNLFDQNGGEEK
jgi:integrase